MATKCECQCQCVHIECQQTTYKQNHVDPRVLKLSLIAGPLVILSAPIPASDELDGSSSTLSRVYDDQCQACAREEHYDCRKVSAHWMYQQAHHTVSPLPTAEGRTVLELSCGRFIESVARLNLSSFNLPSEEDSETSSVTTPHKSTQPARFLVDGKFPTHLMSNPKVDLVKETTKIKMKIPKNMRRTMYYVTLQSGSPRRVEDL